MSTFRFDFPNSKVTIYGEGKNKLSWISLVDVAAIAVASLTLGTASTSALRASSACDQASRC